MKLVEYYKECKNELGKVIFPTKQQIKIALVSVVVVVSVITLFLALVDVFFHYTISSIIG